MRMHVYIYTCTYVYVSYILVYIYVHIYICIIHVCQIFADMSDICWYMDQFSESALPLMSCSVDIQGIPSDTHPTSDSFYHTYGLGVRWHGSIQRLSRSSHVMPSRASKTVQIHQIHRRWRFARMSRLPGVCVCMCVYVSVYIFVYVCVYICVNPTNLPSRFATLWFPGAWERVCWDSQVREYVCVCVCMFLYTCICTCVYMCICVCMSKSSCVSPFVLLFVFASATLDDLTIHRWTRRAQDRQHKSQKRCSWTLCFVIVVEYECCSDSL